MAIHDPAHELDEPGDIYKAIPTHRLVHGKLYRLVNSAGRLVFTSPKCNKWVDIVRDQEIVMTIETILDPKNGTLVRVIHGDVTGYVSAHAGDYIWRELTEEDVSIS